MLPWLLVRIATATSVEGKLEETVVQESNSIHQWAKNDGNKAVPAVHSGFPSLKKFFKRLRKIVSEEGMVAVFLEHAKSLLIIYRIGLLSGLYNVVLMALMWWVEVSEVHLSYPLPTPPLVSLQWLVQSELCLARLCHLSKPSTMSSREKYCCQHKPCLCPGSLPGHLYSERSGRASYCCGGLGKSWDSE